MINEIQNENLVKSHNMVMGSGIYKWYEIRIRMVVSLVGPNRRYVPERRHPKDISIRKRGQGNSNQKMLSGEKLPKRRDWREKDNKIRRTMVKSFKMRRDAAHLSKYM